MRTVSLQIAGDGQSGYRVTLSDFATGGELASENLSSAEITEAEWPPEQITAFFAHDEAGKPNKKLEAVGAQLSGWLLRGKIEKELDAIRPGGLRVLLDIQAPELSCLPWELMGLEMPVPCFLDKDTPFARLRVGQPKAKAEWPLRVLVVVGAAEESDPERGIKAEEEITAITRAIHPYGFSIDREVLRRPTKDKLLERLKELRPHVLLFVGHCDTDNLQRSVLRFQLSSPEVPWDWSAKDVARNLNQVGWTPCIAVLNACRTHEPGASLASFAIADAFMDSGAAASITMQGDVRGDRAGVLAAAVLRGLCEGDPLDVALVKARQEVANVTDQLQRDWAFPVLSLAVEPERIFPKRPACAAYDELAIEFPDTCWFVDRREERRRIRWGPGVSGVEACPQGLVVITGSAGSGKSHLAKWCLEQLAIVYNCQVRYVVAAGLSGLGLLRGIRGPTAGKDAFPPEALYTLNWKLNALLQGKVPAPWNREAVEDGLLEYDGQKEYLEKVVPEICEAFVEALKTAAKVRPVAFVLDQFNRNVDGRNVDGKPQTLTPSAMSEWLSPYLLEPLNDGKISGALGVVVLEVDPHRRDEYAIYGIDRLVPLDKCIRVKPDLQYPHDQLAREFFWYPDDQLWESDLLRIREMAELKLRLTFGTTAIDYLKKLKESARFAYDDDEGKLREQLKVKQMR